MRPLATYIEDAKKNLLDAVLGYKSVYGKSNVDQREALISEEYRKLIWFLFPS